MNNNHKMVESISLLNFQRHRNLHINLVNGINAIIGPSDSGKTSIIRALKWLIRNQPQGFSFKHIPSLCRQSEDSDEVGTSVSVKFGDGIITRIRDKRFNGYIFDKNDLHKEFEALKGHVPEEIVEYLDLPYYCFQEQHTPHFLLTDSSGEVSAKINALMGLDAIDTVIKNVNSIISEAKSEESKSLNKITSLKSRIEALKFLDDAEMSISKLKEWIGELNLLSDNIDTLSRRLVNIASIESKQLEISKFIACEHKVDRLLEEVNRCANVLDRIKVLDNDIKIIDRIEDRISNLSSCISIVYAIDELLSKTEDAIIIQSNIEHLQHIIETATNIESEINDNIHIVLTSDAVEDLMKKIQNFISLTENIFDIQYKVNSLTKIEDKISSTLSDLERCSSDFEMLMKANKVCPLCGSTIS